MPQTKPVIKGSQTCDGAGLVSDQLRRQIVEGGTSEDSEPYEWRLSMRVADVLKSNRQSLATCIPEESITSICTRLSALNIGAFPVCDAHGTLVGIISERDVVRAFARDGARLADLHVRDLMVWRQQEARDEVNVLRDAMIAVRNR